MKTKKTNAIEISLVSNFLSDGSLAWSVRLNAMKFDCISERDAIELAQKLETAIGEHTVNAVDCVSFT